MLAVVTVCPSSVGPGRSDLRGVAISPSTQWAPPSTLATTAAASTTSRRSPASHAPRDIERRSGGLHIRRLRRWSLRKPLRMRSALRSFRTLSAPPDRPPARFPLNDATWREISSLSDEGGGQRVPSMETEACRWMCLRALHGHTAERARTIRGGDPGGRTEEDSGRTGSVHDTARCRSKFIGPDGCVRERERDDEGAHNPGTCRGRTQLYVGMERQLPLAARHTRRRHDRCSHRAVDPVRRWIVSIGGARAGTI